jgi:hypothetical protein
MCTWIDELTIRLSHNGFILHLGVSISLLTYFYQLRVIWIIYNSLQKKTDVLSCFENGSTYDVLKSRFEPF